MAKTENTSAPKSRRVKTPEQKERDKIAARERRKKVKEGTHRIGGKGDFKECLKKRDKNQIAICPNCSRVYNPRRDQETEYCCVNCLGESRWKPFLECAKCHALAGLGYRASATVMGVDCAVVLRIRKKKKINAVLPSSTGWHGVKTEIHVEQDRQKELYAKYERAWMSEVGSSKKFPDWSSLYYQYINRKKQKAMYDSPENLYERASMRSIWLHSVKRIYPDWSPLLYNRRRLMTKEQKAVDNLRTRFKELIKTTKKGGSQRISKLIGCTTQQLASHLESKFTKRMTWDNYGTYWHIDHVLPCSSFDHAVPEQVAQCWHWTNLAPLEAQKNLNKSDSITKPQMQLLLCSSH